MRKKCLWSMPKIFSTPMRHSRKKPASTPLNVRGLVVALNLMFHNVLTKRHQLFNSHRVFCQIGIVINELKI